MNDIGDLIKFHTAPLWRYGGNTHRLVALSWSSMVFLDVAHDPTSFLLFLHLPMVTCISGATFASLSQGSWISRCYQHGADSDADDAYVHAEYRQMW